MKRCETSITYTRPSSSWRNSQLLSCGFSGIMTTGWAGVVCFDPIRGLYPRCVWRRLLFLTGTHSSKRSYYTFTCLSKWIIEWIPALTWIIHGCKIVMNLHRIYKQYRHCFHNFSNFLTVQSHSALKKGTKIPLTRSVSIVKLSRFKKYTQIIFRSCIP